MDLSPHGHTGCSSQGWDQAAIRDELAMQLQAQQRQTLQQQQQQNRPSSSFQEADAIREFHRIQRERGLRMQQDEIAQQQQLSQQQLSQQKLSQQQLSQQQMSQLSQQRQLSPQQQRSPQQLSQRLPQRPLQMASSVIPTVPSPGGSCGRQISPHYSPEQLELKDAITSVIQYAQVRDLSFINSDPRFSIDIYPFIFETLPYLISRPQRRSHERHRIPTD
jgi:WNK lysine deficient protein kinase